MDLKLSFVSFNLRCPPCQLSTFSLHPSATGATNVREAPKGPLLQERLGVLPKLLLKSTKWRTKIQESSDAFHDSALYLTRHGRNLSLKGPLVQGSHGIARPHFQLQTRLSIDVHGTAQGQAKQIHSGVIFIHSPVVHLQAVDKYFYFIGHLLWLPFRHVRASTPCSAPKTTWTLTC